MSRLPVPILLRAAALGASSGARSAAALSHLVLTESGPSRGERVLGSVPSKVAAVGALLIEAVIDKLPLTPARTQLGSFGGRVLVAGLAGWLFARRTNTHPLGPVAVAALAGVATTLIGPPARAAAAKLIGSDLPGALVEDAVATGLAAWACR